MQRLLRGILEVDGRKLAPVAGLVALFVYVASASRDLTFAHYGGDGGELIAASVTLGVPHPPGYPLYVLIGKLASFLPIGAIPFRFSLLSAFSTATAVAVLTRLSHNWFLDSSLNATRFAKQTPIVTGLIFAFTPLVWSQAIIPEVYALNLAIVSILTYLLFTPTRRDKTLVSGLFFGLSLTAHLSSLLLAPAVMLLTPRKWWSRLFAGLLFGLLPLLAVPLLALNKSPIIWGTPVDFNGWLWVISADVYHSLPFSVPPAEWRFDPWLAYASQFLIIALPATVVGLIFTRNQSNKHTYLALGTALAYGLYAVSYDSVDSVVLFLPGVLYFSLAMMRGLIPLGRLGLLLPLALLAINFGHMNLRNDSDLRHSTFRTMDQLPRGAIVVTPGDQTIAAMWYFQIVEGIRKDALVVDRSMYGFDWYREGLRFHNANSDGTLSPDLDSWLDEQAVVRPICELTLLTPPSIDCRGKSY